MASTIISQEQWEDGLAERLDKPQTWKEVCEVIYTDIQSKVLPYIGTTGEPPVQTAFLATAADRNVLSKVIAPGVVTMTTETLQMVSMEYASYYVDYADQVQSRYVGDRAVGEILGKKLGERLEAIVLAAAASQTNFGDTGGGAVGLSANQLTVTANNIDDIMRGVKEQVNTANGANLMRDNGAFIVWRAADWTFLEQFCQANGFNLADQYLKNGADTAGIFYDGIWHYMSTGHTANHLFGGVRKVMKLGLLTGGPAGFGKVIKVDNPASSTAGHLRGSNFFSNFDYGIKVQTNVAPVVFDINVV